MYSLNLLGNYDYDKELNGDEKAFRLISEVYKGAWASLWDQGSLNVMDFTY